MKNKITNNVVWNKVLEAGEKAEIAFSYQVERNTTNKTPSCNNYYVQMYMFSCLTTKNHFALK